MSGFSDMGDHEPRFSVSSRKPSPSGRLAGIWGRVLYSYRSLIAQGWETLQIISSILLP
jgi:hypothetical protein